MVLLAAAALLYLSRVISQSGRFTALGWMTWGVGLTCAGLYGIHPPSPPGPAEILAVPLVLREVFLVAFTGSSSMAFLVVLAALAGMLRAGCRDSVDGVDYYFPRSPTDAFHQVAAATFAGCAVTTACLLLPKATPPTARRDICPECGYRTRGLPTETCPECGTRLPADADRRA